MSLLGLRELRFGSTRSHRWAYDNFRLDIFVREVRDILSFVHSLVENYRFALREVVAGFTISLGWTFSYEKSEISGPLYTPWSTRITVLLY